MTIRMSTAASMLAMLSALNAPAAAAPPEYHATMLADAIEETFPGVPYPSSDARGLNENGDFIGEAGLGGARMQSWLYTVEHGLIALPLLPGWPSAAVRDVTDRDEDGEIVIVGGGVPGVHTDIAIGEAALWRVSTVTGEVLETRALGIPAGFTDSIAIAVNNGGTIVGFSSLTGVFTNWKYDIASGSLETFPFPAHVTDLNNVGQVCGGTYRGDLFGAYEDIVGYPDDGGDWPAWAFDHDSITAAWNRINDSGMMVGRAPTGISDGAGHFLVAILRYADEIGWTSLTPVSHLSLAGGINDRGDFTNRSGGLYLEETGTLYPIHSLVADEFQALVSVSHAPEVNDNLQLATSAAHASLLTPLGVMIIPGDVNGDVTVDLDDYCAWVADPIDLDGDGDVDDADEQWLIDRLAVFGYVVEDCNGNGIGDHCDIIEGTSQDCDGNDVPDECQDDCNGDGVPDVCEPDCNGNGVPDPCDILEGTSEDCNDNGVPDECDLGGVTEVGTAHDPPLHMYQSVVIVDEITVVDAGTVDDVNLTLDISYRLGDFTIELSHAGTTITIMDRPGYPAYLGGFVNFGYDGAIVDDEGTGPFLEYAGDECCSFEALVSPPSYRPDEPLAAFDGLPSEGIWALTVSTTDHFSPGDGISGWDLEITRASVAVPPCCDADLSGDGMVDVTDLLGVLGAWGASGGDVTGDGTTDVSDLLAVLGGWGTCP